MTGPAPDRAGTRGRVLFGVLAIIIVILAILAFRGTGTMGIEERFSSALGLTHEAESPESEATSGFTLEGNPLQYLLVLVLLGGVCWVVYRKFGV